MLFVITVQVTRTEHTYWAYNTNPPLNKGVNWGDMHIPVVFSESSWLPGPKLREEGKEIINYTVGVQGILIHMGNRTHCLNITFPFWLSLLIHSTA